MIKGNKKGFFFFGTLNGKESIENTKHLSLELKMEQLKKEENLIQN